MDILNTCKGFGIGSDDFNFRDFFNVLNNCKSRSRARGPQNQALVAMRLPPASDVLSNFKGVWPSAYVAAQFTSRYENKRRVTRRFPISSRQAVCYRFHCTVFFFCSCHRFLRWVNAVRSTHPGFKFDPVPGKATSNCNINT